MIENEKLAINEALAAYDFGGEIAGALRYGKGHINDTFAVYIQTPEGDVKRFILQRINEHVFKKPLEVMDNIIGITLYLRKIIEGYGGDPLRETLNVIPDKNNNTTFIDASGGYWRCYNFIEDALCLQKAQTQEQFYASARAFGNFQRLLSNYPAHTLHETIPNFHNTKVRLKQLRTVISEDSLGRVKNVVSEIDFAISRSEQCGYLVNLLENGELPLRVTHNDTKLNNVMIDKKSGNGVCVIDLDTIMPGLSVYDFGDSIRFGANTASEDETDLKKVSLDISLYEAYVKGFLETAGGVLTKQEVACLPWGAKLMTLECGIRFLTDYLSGDVYFKIHRENHNLDRCRTQFKLVEDMEKKWDEMFDVVERYS